MLFLVSQQYNKVKVTLRPWIHSEFIMCIAWWNINNAFSMFRYYTNAKGNDGFLNNINIFYGCLSTKKREQGENVIWTMPINHKLYTVELMTFTCKHSCLGQIKEVKRRYINPKRSYLIGWHFWDRIWSLGPTLISKGVKKFLIDLLLLSLLKFLKLISWNTC